MRSYLVNGICCSLLLFGSCLGETPPPAVTPQPTQASPDTAAAPVEDIPAEVVPSEDVPVVDVPAEEVPEAKPSPATKKQSPTEAKATECDKKADPADTVMIDGQKAVEFSIPYRNRKTPVYAFTDVRVICFRKQPMPEGIADLLGDAVKPINEPWSQDFLENRSCLVVSASDEVWKAQAERLNKLRETGDVWATGQVVKFNQKPKSAAYVILDRIGFDIERDHNLEGLTAMAKERGFTITKSDAPVGKRPRPPRYVAIPSSQLSALELVQLLNDSEQVAEVQPEWVSPLQIRGR